MQIDPDVFQERYEAIRQQIQREIVGQQEVIEQTLVAMLAGGHVLLEGVPGLGKTQLVRTLGTVLGLEFKRIQFTPDLMPADIIGTNVLLETDTGGRTFEFQRGPVFAQLVLGDEINRATPRTQAAMLEAMQEQTVSVGGVSHPLPEPFFVLATQNPIEMEGTYRLPEAQLDRFLLKIEVCFPDASELAEILHRTTGNSPPAIDRSSDGTQILEMRHLVRQVPVASHVEERMIQLISRLHPENEDAPASVQRYVRLGPSVRGLQAISLTSRAIALIRGRYNVAFEDIEQVAHAALRHRILLNFEGEAENIQPDTLISEVLAASG